MLLKCLQITKTAELVKEGILIETISLSSIANQAALWNELNVNLYPLAWILHLLVTLWNVFGIWQLHGHLAALAQKAIQTRDGACVAPQPQLYPEYHQAGIGTPAAHILDELDLVGLVLVWMAVRPM